VPKVGRQCVEIQVQPIAGKDRDALRGERLAERVNCRVGSVLRPWAGYPLGDAAPG